MRSSSFISQILLVLALILLLVSPTVSSPANAQSDFLTPSNQTEFLPVDEAFQFDFRQRGDTLILSWDIAPDYYLYQHRFEVQGEQLELASEIDFPEGESHTDEFFGESTIYRDRVELSISIAAAAPDALLTISYQGCADAGLCYPPTEKQVYLDAVGTAPAAGSNYEQIAANSQSAPTSGAGRFIHQLTEQPLYLALLAFFILGIGLAFTPCVFPMYPIISGIIVGYSRAEDQRGQQLTTGRAFSLSLAYVLGMAVTYSALGVVVALAGLQFQAALQHPLILGVLAIIFVVLALSMFGVYELQLPQKWQERLTQASNKKRGGAYPSVFAMGAISGLIASPCTTAPLSGILLFIAQSGDIMVGASALFALSIGMGVPLLLVGTSGGKLLPKAGAWMNSVKVFFGLLLIAVAIVLVDRIVNLLTAQLLWLGFFVLGGVFMLHTVLAHARGWRATLLASLIAVASALGVFWQLPDSQVTHLEFEQVTGIAEVQRQLANASRNDQPVMLDLYADWCIACKEFEKYTFTDAKVQAQLANYKVLQTDVTANNAVNNELLQQYQVLGLPTILFFDADGNELTEQRVTGFLSAAEFSQHLEQLNTD